MRNKIADNLKRLSQVSHPKPLQILTLTKGEGGYKTVYNCSYKNVCVTVLGGRPPLAPKMLFIYDMRTALRNGAGESLK